MEELSAQQMQVYMNTAIELIMTFAPKLILAFVYPQSDVHVHQQNA